MKIKITIRQQVFQKLPLTIAVLRITGFHNDKVDESKHLLQEMQNWVKLSFHKDDLQNHYLIKPWTVAQQEFGKKAVHYQTSVEQLLQGALKRKIHSPHALENIFRYLSLKHFIPGGIDDTQRIDGGLTFSIAKGSEKAGILKKLKRGDLYYYDRQGILGVKLDYWKSRRTKLNSGSSEALIHLEALPPISDKKLKAIVQEAQELVKEFCGGKMKIVFLNKKKKSAVV